MALTCPKPLAAWVHPRNQEIAVNGAKKIIKSHSLAQREAASFEGSQHFSNIIQILGLFRRGDVLTHQRRGAEEGSRPGQASMAAARSHVAAQGWHPVGAAGARISLGEPRRWCLFAQPR